MISYIHFARILKIQFHYNIPKFLAKTFNVSFLAMHFSNIFLKYFQNYFHYFQYGVPFFNLQNLILHSLSSFTSFHLSTCEVHFLLFCSMTVLLFSTSKITCYICKFHLVISSFIVQNYITEVCSMKRFHFSTCKIITYYYMFSYRFRLPTRKTTDFILVPDFCFCYHFWFSKALFFFTSFHSLKNCQWR